MNDKTTDNNGNGATPTPAEIQAKIQASGLGAPPPPLDMTKPGHYLDTRDLQAIVQFIGSNIVFDKAAPLLGMIQGAMKPLDKLPKAPADG